MITFTCQLLQVVDFRERSIAMVALKGGTYTGAPISSECTGAPMARGCAGASLSIVCAGASKWLQVRVKLYGVQHG